MNPGDIVPLSFNPVLVFLSFVVSVLGSYLALTCASKIRTSRGAINSSRLWAAAVALGGVAIWSMHFIGMTAHRMPFPVAYEFGFTIGSLVAAIVVSGLAFWYVGHREFNMRDLLIGGTLAGLGVAIMHYTGMSAMRTRANLVWDPAIVTLSVVIAVVAANVALWLAFKLRTRLERAAAAVVMGVAVCGMHYTGMVAGTIVCTAASASAGLLPLSGQDLPYYVFFVALGTLAVIWVQLISESMAGGSAAAES